MTELDLTRAPGDGAAVVYHYTATGSVPTAPGDGLDLVGHDGAPIDTSVTQAEWDAGNAPGAPHNCALLPAGAYLLHRGYSIGAADPADIADTDFAAVGVIDTGAVVLLTGDTETFSMLIAKAPARLYAAAHVGTDATRTFTLDLWAVRVA